MIAAPARYDVMRRASSRTPIYQARITPVWAAPLPLGYWKLEEASGTRVDELANNALTDNATVTSNPGRVGTAGQFTRANSEFLSATISAGNILQMAGRSFFVSAWVYLDNLSLDGAIAGQYGPGSSTARSWILSHTASTNRFTFSIAESGTPDVQVTVTASAFGDAASQTWYLVNAWWDSNAGTVNIQINNGTVNSTATALIPATVTEAFRIGAARASAVADTFWNGRIDEAGIWDVVLSDEQRDWRYNGGSGITYAQWFSGPPDPEIVYTLATAWPQNGENIGLRLLEPLEIVRRTEVEYSRFPLSTCKVLLHDFDNQGHAIVAAGIEGYRLELRSSFWELDWSAAVLLFTGIITEITQDAGSFRITVRSKMAAALDKILFAGAETRLTSAISSTDTTVPVVSTVAFDAAVDTPQEGRKEALIENEIMVYRSMAALNLLNVIRVGAAGFAVPPLYPASVATGHASGAVVKELLGFGKLTGDNDETIGVNDQHPIDYLERIVTEESGKLGVAEAGIPVNAAELAGVRAALGAELRFRFLLDEPINAKRFLEEEIYLPLAASPTENEAGEIGIKLHGAGANATIVDTLTDDRITRFPKWIRNAGKIFNKVIYHYDYLPGVLPDPYTSTYPYPDNELISAMGREIPLHIYSKGIRSFYVSAGGLEWFSATEAFLEDAAKRHIARGNEAPVISVSALLSEQLFVCGDDVEATFEHVIDLTSAGNAIADKPMEVIAMRHDFRSNLIDMELLGYLTT